MTTDAPMTVCKGGIHDLAHSSACVVRGLRSVDGAPHAKVKVKSLQIGPGPRPDAVDITTTCHQDKGRVSSSVTLALIKNCDRCIFEYEGIRHAELHRTRLAHTSQTTTAEEER